MRLVHSFSSEYCTKEKFDLYMYYFALSCIYAKESGFEMVLHCDNKTESILRNAPYDEIITDIPHIDPELKAFYAMPKFYAMTNEDLGAIHIDGDVFIKSPELLDLMKFDNYDCIVQCVEKPERGWGYGWDTAKAMFRNCAYPEWAKRKCKAMCNCGIVGINNKELKDEYFNTYWKMLNQFKIKGESREFGIPDLIIEQQFLKDLTTRKDYSVKELIDFNNLEGAKKIGYQHVIGYNKEVNLDKVKLLVKKHNKDTYDKITHLL